jgi:hypothetical protein
MKEVKSLHRLAMEKTDLALAAKLKGDSEQALIFFKEAFQLEANAANALATEDAAEPTRSVLFRSAASLALDCNFLTEAEKLICTALVGNPPYEIAEELRDLLEQVYFMRHLQIRGISLREDEIQMSIAGKAIGFGIAPTDTFLDRVEKTENLLYRTAERKQRKPFRERGRREKRLSEAFELYMTAPRAASFAVTFRVGKNDQLSLLPDLSMEESVIDELLECLEIFARGDEEQLKSRITEEAYYRNFVALAAGLAPDGENVKVVGFTTQRRGQIRKVAITATGNRITPPAVAPPVEVAEPTPPPQDKTVTLTGDLKFADATHAGRDEIQIIDADHKAHVITVPPGLMNDIVKPLWDSTVTVTGTLRGEKIILQDIRPTDTD